MASYDLYLNSLAEKLKKSFDLTPEYSFKDHSYDLMASMNIRNEKFVLTPDVKLYGFENNEIFFINQTKELNLSSIQDELDFLKSHIREIADPRKDHMSTSISLVLVSTAPPSDETEKFIKRYFYQKSFTFGFKGWADLTVIAICLSERKVIAGNKIKKTAAFFQPDAA